MNSPRLRTVEKYQPLYSLNQFPADFALSLGRELVCHLALRSSRLEGQDWEEIFARLIHAEWKPSNVGLDDVVFEQCAWGAKTVKSPKPATAKKVRLISGRNSLDFSYNVNDARAHAPDELGQMILDIWNERVSAIRKLYKHLRTVVLVKSDDLLEVAVFELDTVRYEAADYDWCWNARNNLEACHKQRKNHCFTWQPHGAQFTIIESVPENRLALRVKQPPPINKDDYLKVINFNADWVKVL